MPLTFEITLKFISLALSLSVNVSLPLTTRVDADVAPIRVLLLVPQENGRSFPVLGQ